MRIEPWIQARAQQLLPCDHYHVIFTVPHDLEPLWHRNRTRMNDRLFRAVRDTLLELLADEKYLGARPGVLAALHTWGRTLSFHPHIHALVTGGGWDGRGFKPVRNGFLLPFRVVRALFRGKLLAALREDQAQRRLVLPAGLSETRLANLLRRLGRRKWNVHVSQRYPHARGVVTYLGRYLRGGPIGNQRLISVDSHGVRFQYTDHRDGGELADAAPARAVHPAHRLARPRARPTSRALLGPVRSRKRGSARAGARRTSVRGAPTRFNPPSPIA